ncbi:unnamed protein product [Linum trigynum]|uniref:Uncharacterized protein n=1 Tax=Linum trigynum TaxID=586398 RepID=A0AAV2DQE0_9ROSI
MQSSEHSETRCKGKESLVVHVMRKDIHEILDGAQPSNPVGGRVSKELATTLINVVLDYAAVFVRVIFDADLVDRGGFVTA